jgi:hypothetical protein
MRESRKSELGSSLAVIGIALVAFLLIIALNSLAWPVGSALEHVVSELPTPIVIPDGVLLVTVNSNQTNLPAVIDNSTAPFVVGNQERDVLTGITVSVFVSTVTSPTITNYTDSLGQIQENLAPNTYSVKFYDWRLSNLSVPVQVNSDSITDLNVTVDASSYHVQSLNLDDQDSSGWVVAWGQIFALVETNRSVTSPNQAIFLDTQYSQTTPINNLNEKYLNPISVSEVSQTDYSQWLQIQVKNPMNIGSIQTMSVLTLRSQYVVSTNVIQ